MKRTCLWELFKRNHVQWLEYYTKQKLNVLKSWTPMHKWIWELQMVWREKSILGRSRYELYREIKKNSWQINYWNYIRSRISILKWTHKCASSWKRIYIVEEQWNMKTEMAIKNIWKQNKCVEVAKEYPNDSKYSNAINKVLSELIQIPLIMCELIYLNSIDKRNKYIMTHEMKKSSGDIHITMYILFSQAGKCICYILKLFRKRHY